MADELDRKEKLEEAEQVLLVLENIREGGSIERFKFTAKETSAINFIIDVLKENLRDLGKKIS